MGMGRDGAEEAGHVVFDDAEQALCWAAEVLRRRRWPKLCALWREVGGESEAEYVAGRWGGERLVGLPLDAEDRLSLALKVEDALAGVVARDGVAGQLLRLWAWGDWADEARLRGAMAVQEKCRREGLRVRVAYRYSYAQLGFLLGCDRKAAWRQVQAAVMLLGEELGKRGLVVTVEAPAAVDNLKKGVQLSDFKMYDE